jgi:hypothetical protein
MNKRTLAELARIGAEARRLCDEVENIMIAEQERVDSRSDKWRESDVGETAAARLDDLETIVSTLDDATNALEAFNAE